MTAIPDCFEFGYRCLKIANRKAAPYVDHYRQASRRIQ